MLVDSDDTLAQAEITARLRIVLPENYRDTFDSVQPVPMGSAGFKFAADGRVAWDEIWGSFCDLAMAGGPPHKGKLLGPASAADVAANLNRYGEVVDEICRGIELVTSMPCEPSDDPGWVRVECYSETMAAWLVRAITIENVAVRAAGATLDLPASPAFRLEKEIKNVITVIAKTSHYWLEHMPRQQQRAIATLFAQLETESPLIAPPADADAKSLQPHPGADALAANISRMTGLRPATRRYAGWIGFECASVADAVRMMRALIVFNVLARREEQTLFVPVNPRTDSNGARVAAALTRVHRLNARQR